MSIKLLVLVSGPEIIGDVISEEPTYYVIKRPRGLHVDPQPDGSYNIHLVPFSAVNVDGTFKLYKHALCGENMDGVPADIEQMYVKQTSTIQLLGK